MGVAIEAAGFAGASEMEQAMNGKASRGDRRPNLRGAVLGALLALGALLVARPGLASEAKTFPTPQAAAQALVDAVKSGDKQAILAVLGSDAQDIVSSGDPVQDKESAEKFTTSAQQMMHVDQTPDGIDIMSIGTDDWPFPIPIVKRGDGWFFDTLAGKQELLNRRVGANELDTIEVCRAYVEAQREYASDVRDDSGVMKYAERLISSDGKKDGLYWPPKDGEAASPFGPLVADAQEEGYSNKRAPYHGYFYRVLTAQGKAAPGGAYSYIINGNMIAGFALVAYPAQYGSSGVMTFIVNQQGVVYQKDLGLKTEVIAKAMKIYNPDSSWQKAQ
jgi:Protein of unknown function (DUF2950)